MKNSIYVTDFDSKSKIIYLSFIIIFDNIYIYYDYTDQKEKMKQNIVIICIFYNYVSGNLLNVSL
jgi:hypothetical protein